MNITQVMDCQSQWRMHQGWVHAYGTYTPRRQAVRHQNSPWSRAVILAKHKCETVIDRFGELIAPHLETVLVDDEEYIITHVPTDDCNEEYLFAGFGLPATALLAGSIYGNLKHRDNVLIATLLAQTRQKDRKQHHCQNESERFNNVRGLYTVTNTELVQGKNIILVDDVMDAHMVIPLVSPPYYAPYNGGVERGHQEILKQLDQRIGSERVCSRVFRLEREASGHAVDHIRRDSLGGLTACEVFESGRHLLKQFGRRERKEAYEEIKGIAVDIAKELREHNGDVVETAFRFAAETWMQQKQLIRVSRNGKVLTSYYRFQSH